MPRPATPESGVPYKTKIKRAIMGRGKDVRLPMEAGQTRDPRLPPPTTTQAAREGLDVVRDLTRTRKDKRSKTDRGRRR